MRMIVAVALLLLCGSQVPEPGISAITHVTLIDGTGAAATLDVTVLIEDDEIRRIDPSAAVDIPAGAEVIDGRGRFLLPGFWDMHVHVSRSLGGPGVLPVFLAYGVTGVRDVGSSDSIATWARETASATRLGPRILQAGPQIGVWADYGGPQQAHLDEVKSAEDVRRVIERRRGWADYIKLQDGFTPRDRWLAVARAARQEGYLLAGHIPVNVPLIEAVDAGLRSIEHTFGLPLALSEAELSLRSKVMSAAEPWWDDLVAADVEALGSLDEERLAQLVHHMIRAEAALDPTLIEVSNMAVGWTQQWDHDPRLSYLPAAVHNRWRQSMEGMDAAYIANLKVLWGAMPGLVKRIHDMGVMIVAGSGAGTYFTFPGSGLHDELSLLVDAGLSPMEAIQAATRNPMILMGRSDSLGTVEVGKKADLVLLDGDPLEDISNTRRIVSVWSGGRYYDRAELDGMLEAVAAQQTIRP